MRTPLPVVLFLLLTLSALVPLALASPPDPLWIGGVFDAGDFDDVVVAATFTDGLTDDAALDSVKALWLVIGPALPALSADAVHCAPPSLRGRAPPIV
jgi:hypothetical protein